MMLVYSVIQDSLVGPSAGSIEMNQWRTRKPILARMIYNVECKLFKFNEVIFMNALRETFMNFSVFFLFLILFRI